MAALEAAQQQLESAVARLEATAARMAGRRGEPLPAAASDELDGLREECERLARELEAAATANARLAAATEEAERRLGEAMRHLETIGGD